MSDVTGAPLSDWEPRIGDIVELKDGREARLVGSTYERGGSMRYFLEGLPEEFRIEDIAGVSPLQLPERYEA